VTKGDKIMMKKIDRFEVEKIVRKVIIKTLRLTGEEKKIRNETNIKSDYGLENTDLAKLFEEIGIKFGISIIDGDDFETFKVLIDTIMEKLKKREIKEKLEKK